MSKNCLYCYTPLVGEVDFHAKCSLNFFGTEIPPLLPYSLGEMTELAKNVVESRVTVPGVQAKLSMTIVKNVMEKSGSRLTVVGVLGGNYILKPPSKDYAMLPENEHITMRIAEAVGIRVVPSSLIRLASGELAYITKRIDRSEDGDKIHMLDMYQITEAFDKYKGSMEKVGKALRNYSSNTLLDLVFYFEIVLFSYLSGNNDMHLKNFSMIESPSGWALAPAYDLLNVAIALPQDTEELALTLEGKKKKLKRSDFENFGQNLGLTRKQVDGVFNRFVKNKPKIHSWLDRCFLSEDLKIAYKNLVDSRFEKLNLN